MATITKIDLSGHQPAPVKDPPYAFGSSAFNGVIDHLRQVIKTGPLNPASEIKYYRSITEARSYSFYSGPSLADWNRKYLVYDELTIRTNANQDTQQFLNTVKTLGNTEHEKNRMRFDNEFDGSEKKVNEFFYNARSEEAGRHLRPFQNSSWEEKILNCGPISSLQQEFERKILRDLMSAKWAAVGSYLDLGYKDRYLSDYAIALK